MVQFEDKDLIMQKALASAVIAELLPASEKLKKKCEKQVSEINEIERKLQNAENFGQVDEFFKTSQTKRESFVKVLAFRDRIEKIIKRNKIRVEHFDKIFKASGIYNESFDKKEFEEIEKLNLENLTEKSVGIDGENFKVQKFFAGTVFTFVAGKLDFSVEENKNILKSADETVIHEIVSTFPESVATITADVLADYMVKRKILKEITAYVYDEAKRKDFREINKSLGSLLSFRKEIPDSLETYVVGVQNMFNVMVKQFLKVTFPSRAEDIERALKCNPDSELIPEEKRDLFGSNNQPDDALLSAKSDIQYGALVDVDENEESSDSQISITENDEAALELLEALGIGIDAFKDNETDQ